MVPELPKEVWTLVLGKLEDVGDWGRLQQVSGTFYAILDDVAWSKKIKGFGAAYRGQDLWISVEAEGGKQELALPSEKRLLLVAELVRKATNITKVSFSFIFLPRQEYAEFLGPALEKLASAPQKINSFHIEGDLVMLGPAVQSLAAFLGAKKQSIQHLTILHRVLAVHKDLFGMDRRKPPKMPSELRQALRDCSELESVQLDCFKCGWNDPLLKDIVRGKKKLKKLGVFGWDVPAGIILKSKLQLEEFGCWSMFLDEYVEAIWMEKKGRRRGWSAMSKRQLKHHPLFTVKKLSLEGDQIDAPYPLMPDLERLEALSEVPVRSELIPFLRSFLKGLKDFPDGQKQLTCDIQRVVGVESVQELTEAFQAKFPCQMTVNALDDGKTELSFIHGNASIICRLGEVHSPESDEDDMDFSEGEGSSFEMEFGEGEEEEEEESSSSEESDSDEEEEEEEEESDEEAEDEEEME